MRTSGRCSAPIQINQIGNFIRSIFLAIDESADKDTEARYHFPVGKENTVFIRAVDAIRSRSAQEGEQDIFKAAGEIEQVIKDYQQSKEEKPKREAPQGHIEYRALAECRVSDSTDDGSIGTVSGSIQFGSLSGDLGGFREQIDPSAFDQSLAGGDIVALYQHDKTKPLASQRSGTLHLIKTPQAIQYTASLPDTSYARDLKALMHGKRQEMRGSSFGFQTLEDTWSKPQGKGLPIRTVKKAHLVEISPVVDPAYTQNSLSVRSIIPPEMRESEPEQPKSEAKPPENTPKVIPLSVAKRVIESKKHLN